MSSTSEKRFAFSTLFSFGNTEKWAGAKSGKYDGRSLAEMPYLPDFVQVAYPCRKYEQ
jgi:hypothetical protein